MNRIFCVFISLLLATQTFAQRTSFAYFQTENGQPFYIKTGDKVKSSTASGYLIFPQLADSTYRIQIGFPNQKWPEQSFTYTIKGQDRGFLLKNFAERGWGLFDLQTLTVTMSESASANAPVETKPVSDFTNLLSKAANDPSLKEPTIIRKAEPAAPVVKEVVKAEVGEQVQASSPVIDTVKKAEEIKAIPDAAAVAIQQEEKQVPAPVQPVIVKEIDYSPSRVMRGTENSTTEGMSILFVDEMADGAKDTISILIPPPPYRPPAPATNPENDKRFLDIQAKANETAIEISGEDKDSKAGTVSANNCKSVASQNDFLKLRKKMAAQKTDDGMLDEARKAFRQKCYTTAQLKGLHTLFLNDAARYQFFDAAYAYVSDKDAFSALESEFRNEYYLKRFRAIVQ